jgi:hypothetical protein
VAGAAPQQVTIRSQAEWVNNLKCNACHQVGNQSTPDFNRPWSIPQQHGCVERAMRSGQTAATPSWIDWRA